MPRAILFDLDGTLVDTRAASWELFSETNLAFALGIDSRDQFFRTFEGNFFESLARLVPDPKRAADAKAHFMELLRTRYHPALIPGMVDIVRALAPHCTLAVISTNGMETIRRILVEAGIATCFSHVFSGDVEPSKAASMRRFLGDGRYGAQRFCSPAYQDGQRQPGAMRPDDVVLVTDTVGDVIEARETGVRAIGVAWGMHSERQLLEAGAERVALWPQELVAWLRVSDRPSSVCSCTVTSAGVSGEAVTCAATPASSPKLGTGDPVVEAGRLRREQQLQTRKTQAGILNGRASSSDSGERQSPPTAAQGELLHALRRILRSDA
jgi:phosphoglycolate phosphatase